MYRQEETEIPIFCMGPTFRHTTHLPFVRMSSQNHVTIYRGYFHIIISFSTSRRYKVIKEHNNKQGRSIKRVKLCDVLGKNNRERLF